MYKLVLIRHGESRGTSTTGWVGVARPIPGATQAQRRRSPRSRKPASFDVAYTSVLKRAIRTLWHVQDEMDQMWIRCATNGA
jgi:2,3-bisphosphoglycerate-dependent phosphoglycerate mutase